MADEKPKRIAFLPEAQGSKRIWQAIEGARQMADAQDFGSMKIAIEQSLKRRSEILEGFGREFFNTGLDGLDPKADLPSFLARYIPKDD